MSIKTAVRILFFIAAYRLHRCFGKVREDRVFFVTDASDELHGNMKCIHDALKDRGLDIMIYCRAKQLHSRTSADVTAVAKGLASAKYIFLEDVLDYLEFIDPAENQEIIQLWHGAGAFKMFGFSRPDGAAGKVRVSKGHRKYTKAITSSRKINWCYAQAFDISENKVAATGIPRTDIFFDDEYKARVREKFAADHPDAAGKKIILFAPTYRGNRISEAGYDMGKLDLGRLKAQLGDEYRVIFKWHPAAYRNMQAHGSGYDLRAYDGYFMDRSDADINELLVAADVLVTDYSSVIFEFALMDKPIVFYTYDLDEYISERGLYYPFDRYVYGRTAVSQNELADAILAEDTMPDKRKDFREMFMDACDGGSTERVMNLIFNENSDN
ncbi:MAG: CDP-glycerol glycerophosphotransferase family protein [Bacillota bacterium]|nr:CDP-glycerol glycerophosphotransferase family protein [Bacillota bacterium]